MLTGAGVSAESGLATFRGVDGLWENHDPTELATPEAFARDPALVYRFYGDRLARLATVEPNAAHRAIARLQRQFRGDVFLVTQNVDDLHERGGSPQVCHMHGELTRVLCNRCGDRTAATAPYDGATPCRACGRRGALRPDVVWFGEVPYQMPQIESRLAVCDLFVAIGTSGTVYPAAGFVGIARRGGAATLEVNLESSGPAGCFQESLLGPATVEVPRLVERLLALDGGKGSACGRD
jgi:NAD-dependent deacetylase